MMNRKKMEELAHKAYNKDNLDAMYAVTCLALERIRTLESSVSSALAVMENVESDDSELESGRAILHRLIDTH